LRRPEQLEATRLRVAIDRGAVAGENLRVTPHTDCPLTRDNPPDPDLERVLRQAKTIAVVGLSSDPDRPSHGVARYLKDAGYRIIPVNPGQAEILGEKCYASLDDVPERVDMANLFLKPERIPPVVDAAIRKGVSCVWMQLGLVPAGAAAQARAAGITVVMNRCTKIEHARLIGSPS
jgi:hypothetical protein